MSSLYTKAKLNFACTIEKKPKASKIKQNNFRNLNTDKKARSLAYNAPWLLENVYRGEAEL